MPELFAVPARGSRHEDVGSGGDLHPVGDGRLHRLEVPVCDVVDLLERVVRHPEFQAAVDQVLDDEPGRHQDGSGV
ncbi:hypothetical protein DF186_25580, partial [Enterococcus hirae]